MIHNITELIMLDRTRQRQNLTKQDKTKLHNKVAMEGEREMKRREREEKREREREKKKKGWTEEMLEIILDPGSWRFIFLNKNLLNPLLKLKCVGLLQIESEREFQSFEPVKINVLFVRSVLVLGR